MGFRLVPSKILTDHLWEELRCSRKCLTNPLLLRLEFDGRLSPVVALDDVSVLVEYLHPAIELGLEGVGLCLILPHQDRGVDALPLIGDEIKADETGCRLHFASTMKR